MLMKAYFRTALSLNLLSPDFQIIESLKIKFHFYSVSDIQEFPEGFSDTTCFASINGGLRSLPKLLT